MMADIQMSLADLVLQVKDVKRAASFYRHALGFVVQGEPTDEQAWLWIGESGASQHLILCKGALPYEVYSPNPEGKRWGAVHFTLSVPTKQLEAAIRQVRLHGIEVRGPQQLAGADSVAFYFYDFDGNLIALRSR
jgi:catechol-2,3-dioxygenase